MATITTHHRGLDLRAPLIGVLAVILAAGAAIAIWRIADSSDGQSATSGAEEAELAVPNDIRPTEPVFTDAWLEANRAARVGTHLAGDSPFTDAWLEAQVAQRQPSARLAETPFTDAWLEAQVAQRQPSARLAESPFTDAWLEAQVAQR